MNKNSFVVLRAPSAQNMLHKQEMGNIGVGFIDSVTTRTGQKRTTVHLVPEQPLQKGQTILVFPAKGRTLPIELIGHTDPIVKGGKGTKPAFFLMLGSDDPEYPVTVEGQPPTHKPNELVGSGWLYAGKDNPYISVKVNKTFTRVKIGTTENGVPYEQVDTRVTLFPRFVQQSTAQPRAQQPAKPAPNTLEAWEAALAKNGFVLREEERP